MKKRFPLIVLLLLVFLAVSFAFGIDRFPRPDFDSGYTHPETSHPGARAFWLQWVDVAVLLGTLALAALLSLKWRSRRGIFWLVVFAAAYFGFFRGGCICPIGAIQNVAAAVFQPGVPIAVVTVVFFTVPLLAALFVGRAFCAGVCPLGALQDLFIIKPLRLPRALTSVLSFFPYIYLGLAVLFAANGAGFIICRFDPFISFFRLNGPAYAVLLGVGFLALGTVIARPYCRFICPYAVLLKWCSRFSARRVTVTPAECVDCRLCENACPVDAIRYPQEWGGQTTPFAKKRRQVIIALIITPLLMAVLGFAGYRLGPYLATVHRDVALERHLPGADKSPERPSTWETRAFQEGRRERADLQRSAAVVVRRFRVGSVVLGIFLALVFAGRWLVSIRRQPIKGEGVRGDHVPDDDCLSCGRCFAYCPVDERSGLSWSEVWTNSENNH